MGIRDQWVVALLRGTVGGDTRDTVEARAPVAQWQRQAT